MGAHISSPDFQDGSFTAYGWFIALFSMEIIPQMLTIATYEQQIHKQVNLSVEPVQEHEFVQSARVYLLRA